MSRLTLTARKNLLELTPDAARAALVEFATAEGLPRYRVDQVVRHLWSQPVATFAELTTLPQALRAQLDERFELPRLELRAEQRSTDGTRKFLFSLSDGQAIETVAIPDGSRLTFCVSSQAGCALKCAFCATGAMGFARQLTAFEIAGQVRELALLDQGLRTATVVADEDPTLLYSLTREAFDGLCNADAGLGYLMMRNIALDLAFKLRHQNLDS